MSRQTLPLRTQATDSNFSALYGAALAAFIEGRLDDALSALSGCERWDAPLAAEGVLLAAKAMSYREPGIASAYLLRHGDLCGAQNPIAYHGALGRCKSLEGDAAAAQAAFEKAREFTRAAFGPHAALDFEEARARMLLGRSDPGCREMVGAFADPSPYAQANAFHFRAGMHEALGNYRAQMADLAQSLRISRTHRSECEMLVTANVVKHLARGAFELSDRAAMESAREAFEEIPLLPATRSDIYTILRTFANDASLQGDSLGAQRLLRRSEEVATKVAQRISAFVGRASVAHQAGSALWAAEEVGQAHELAQRVDWERASADDCFVLCEIARIAAEIDIDLALDYLTRYKKLRAKIPGPHPYDERRIIGFERYREGVIRARAGERAAAQKLLEESYAIWAPIEHHVRAGLAASELHKLTGGPKWLDALARHAAACNAKGWLPVPAPRPPAPVPDVDNGQRRYEAAKSDFLAGRLSEAAAALAGCENWSDACRADAIVLFTTVLARMRRATEVEEYLLREGAVLCDLRPTAYYAILGLCRAVRRDARGSTVHFKRAREHEATASDADRTHLAHAIALGRYYCGKADPLSAEMAQALGAQVPRELQATLYLRASMHMWLGDFRAQIRDLCAALDVAEVHPLECEVAMTTRIARDLVSAGMELSDERAFRRGREAIEKLPAAPCAMADQVEARMRFAMLAFLGGDPGIAQRILRETEAWALEAPTRLALHARRGYIAILSGNALWGAEETALALELAEAIDWEAESSVGIFALADLSRTLAEAGSSRALEFFDLYRRLHAVVGGLPHIDTRRFDAFVAWAEGVIRARMGEKDAALPLLEESYRVFAPIDHHLRAALAARELYVLTNAKRWRDALFRHSQACNAKAWCVAPDFAGEADDDYASLTPTQREIFRAICDGLTVAEIARDTSRSVFTINKHLQAVYATFGVHSRAELRAEAKLRSL